MDGAGLGRPSCLVAGQSFPEVTETGQPASWGAAGSFGSLHGPRPSRVLVPRCLAGPSPEPKHEHPAGRGVGLPDEGQ